ncbi:hypothetical protein NPIL_167061, partial [Nephila pilipes]
MRNYLSLDVVSSRRVIRVTFIVNNVDGSMLYFKVTKIAARKLPQSNGDHAIVEWYAAAGVGVWASCFKPDYVSSRPE